MNFKPSPDTTFQQLIDQMMLAFCEAYTMCCNGEPRRVIIETDRPQSSDGDTWLCYYMIDFTEDTGALLNDCNKQRIVCTVCDTLDYYEEASTYTQAVKLIEDLAQTEQQHITDVYIESF